MRQRTRVKICGITRVEDAKAAVKSGADAIGLVFYAASPRSVDIQQAQKIVQALPAFVTTTALFVDPQPGLVQDVIDKLKIDLLQFHGNETAEFCQSFSRPYIKAVAMQTNTDLVAIANQYKLAIGLLLDTYKAGVPGGTGETFNWQWVPKQFSMPLILAGGLTAGNVRQAISETSPWAVDVSGGVEQAKGIKSAHKIQQFIEQVNVEYLNGLHA